MSEKKFLDEINITKIAKEKNKFIFNYINQ